MSMPVKLKDGGGTNIESRINEFGVLAVGPLNFSQAYSATIVADNVPVNILGPNNQDNFIVTGIYVKGSRDINATVDSNFVLYESNDGPASATQSKVILNVPVGRSESITLSNLNLELSKNVWLNTVGSDATISIAVFGYYVKSLKQS